MRHVWLPLCVLTLACPERATPDRGVMLVFRKPDSEVLRPVVDRRLAHLKLKAHLQEDKSTLTIRVRDGEKADPELIKQLITFPGSLSFCPEDIPMAESWCARELPASVTRETAATTCALSATTQADLDALFPSDAGVVNDFAVEHDERRHVAYAVMRRKCMTPHFIAVELLKGAEPNLMLDFDKNGTAEFAELTTALVKKRMIILLDGEVRGAPLVLEPLTAGRAGLLLKKSENADLLGAVLVGGPLPKLTLEKVGRYGPPSLR
jgi:hypothetical protein